MNFSFQPNELRVLGCLVEKRFSTPDAYPLTLNSLIAACNQSSNRDPVVHYDHSVVDAALKSTRSQGFSIIFSGADSRVPRYKETICDKLGLSRTEASILAELLLRGSQTPGELRQRASRMCEFIDFEAVELALQAMAQREVPLVVALPRQPGKREVRYAHLLGGPVELTQEPARPAEGLEERVVALEKQVAELQGLVSELRGLLT